MIARAGRTTGVGKTSLALRWAHRASDHFTNGRLHVAMRGAKLNKLVRHFPSESPYPRSFFSLAQVSKPPLAKGNRIPDSRRVSAKVEAPARV